MYRLSFGLAALLLSMLLVAAGCTVNGDSGATPAEDLADDSTSTRPEASDSDAEPALPVELQTLGRGSIESALRASANLEAETQVEVHARSEGLVRELFVEEGHRVRKGELLLRLEADDQRNQVARSASQLEKARREYERQQRLFSQQLVSEQAFNESTYEIEQLELSLEDAERQLAHTEVRAPISGTVTARVVNKGDRVQPGVHLFSLVDFNSLVARIYVPERELNRLQPGLSARVSSQALADEKFTGRLARVAPIVDAKSGTVKATVSIGRQPGLLPGMYVDVSLVTETHKNALLVPKRALAYDGEQAYVYRLREDSRVERIFVEPELADSDFVEPRGADLKQGDQVVVAGQAALKNGALVRPIDRERSNSSARPQMAEAGR